MGLLTKVVLPFNALCNGGCFAQVLAQDWDPVRAQWTDTSINLMERHLWNVLAATNLCTTINNIAAIASGNPVYQMMVCAMQILFGLIDVLDWIRFGIEPIYATYTLVIVILVNVIGLVSHMNEQGLFTKYKSAFGKKLIIWGEKMSS